MTNKSKTEREKEYKSIVYELICDMVADGYVEYAEKLAARYGLLRMFPDNYFDNCR